MTTSLSLTYQLNELTSVSTYSALIVQFMV